MASRATLSQKQTDGQLLEMDQTPSNNQTYTYYGESGLLAMMM